ncbi:50S ribosomal protein L29 [Aliifodinibius salicampi]|jgi:large subunit ribosomal protein L29|uniref:Large ribosomal subunit protein uL29 n=1 Tax=Fodinibius salicampi TaxID=1920655 RepID=A0ABT3Q3B0_9BACT|nr:50S ribosomal protein L29 [Fodinibius salicampi]MCW9714583.1 50S ribosomal protein L29 [Fodinibius salicampi]
MKAHELRELTITELKSRLEDEKQALQDMKFNHAIAGQLENPARVTMTRREIARLHTIITEKEQEESAG